jgi:hypothetical protein
MMAHKRVAAGRGLWMPPSVQIMTSATAVSAVRLIAKAVMIAAGT